MAAYYFFNTSKTVSRSLPSRNVAKYIRSNTPIPIKAVWRPHDPASREIPISSVGAILLASVTKTSVQVDDALEECRTHWKEDPVFYTVFLLFVVGVLFWSIPVSPAQCDTCQNTTDCWVV